MNEPRTSHHHRIEGRMAGLAAEHRGAPAPPKPPVRPGTGGTDPAAARGLDPATGSVVLGAVDIELPGVLPLVLERHFHGRRRSGRRFGKAWASTLDQCLVLRPRGVRLLTEDGRVLEYPVPPPGTAVLPVTGPRWPLEWDGAPGGPMTVRRPETGRALRYAPVPGAPGAALPLIAVEDRNGNGVRVEYDGDGLPCAVAGTDGHRVAVGTEDGRVTGLWLPGEPGEPPLRRFHYDAAGRLCAVEGPNGPAAKLSYDANGRLTGYADGTGEGCRYTYGGDGRVTAVEGPDGRGTATPAHDPGERRTSLTDSLGHTTVYAYDEHRRIVAVTDPLGQTTRWEWDELGRPVGVIDPLGRATRYAYGASGGVASVTHPDGTVVRAEYDALGRVTAVVQEDGERWEFTLDERGNRRSERAPDGTVTTFGLDARGARVAVTDALGGVWRIEPDAAGRPAAVTDPTGRTTRAAAGPAPAPRPADDVELTRVTDSEGRPTCLTDARGTSWTYAYDPAGRLVEESDSTGHSVRYRHDAAGQPVGWTNSAGQRVSHTFDGRGRLVEQRSDSDIARFRYDAAGRLVSAANGETEVSWERDAATGAVLAETCNGRTVRFRYDALGRLTERQAPSGAVGRFEYDGAGRPACLRAGELCLEFAYDAGGCETERRLGGTEAALRQEWNAAGRLVAQVLPTGARRVFRYREDGLPVAVEDPAAGTLALSLDAGGRVLAAEGPGGRVEFTHDPDGGLAGAGSRTDGQGRVVQAAGGRGLSWDALDRLTDVVTPEGQHWHYVYDPLGRRVAKQLLDDYGSVVEQTVFVWEGVKLAEEIAPDGSAVGWHWARRGHRPLARTEHGDGGRDFAIVTDAIGTPSELVDAAGGVAWRRRASFWGAPEGGADAMALCPFGFPGQYLDGETGLFHNGRRYYDPAAARYLSPDPRGLGPAPYAYVTHPLAFAAPLGLPGGTPERAPAFTPGDVPGPDQVLRARW
ncbi:RHS repeat-associated core domain-containing protein [Streptomyces litchfieldiae]|uniref:RHS repeat-associated core domain-containing protein n=1 Tax=Streptomyces litchfieldiae TaxID=3075543 RepID=A0ABU2MUN1_9ACTN|nr:RHS repeat-associated core domain-containing protein [Streptomyces sp. DSM 44938]MDT0345235.1 RHS repeat-associated core domain-containing protein [Streptomyces sp. DSM 44938]